jgi:hypothetical protein
MQSERPCSIVQSVVERLCFPPLVVLIHFFVVDDFGTTLRFICLVKDL